MERRTITFEQYNKEMADRFSSINEEFIKNHITWFATGGTLIGAMRYENIIPWDDDIDMGITTKEFYSNKEKINDIVENKGYYIWDKRDHLSANCIKFMSKELVDVIYNGKTYTMNFFIDLFLWIPIKKDSKLRNKVISAYNSITFIFNNWKIALPPYAIRKGKIVKINPILNFLVWLARLPIFPIVYIWYLFERNKFQYKEKINYKENQLYVSHWKRSSNAIYFRENELIKGKFNNTEIQIPANYEFLLNRQYGSNWIIEPSTEDRYPTHIINWSWYDRQHKKYIKKNA